MGLILVIAFLATGGFYRRARQIGIHPGRAASIPFVGAGLMLAFTYVVDFVFRQLLERTDVSEIAASWMGYAISWFLILTYVCYIKRNWDALSSSPPLGK